MLLWHSVIKINAAHKKSYGRISAQLMLGGRECYHEGTLNVVPVNYTSVGSQLIVEGIVQVCNSNQEYESVCDIGWDTQDARVFCSYFLDGEYGKHRAHNLVHAINLLSLRL